MIPKIYIGENLQDEKAQKIISKLKKMKIMQQDADFKLIIGSTSLWALDPCFVMTDKEIVVFNQTIKIPKYPYNSITGYEVKQGIGLSNIYLYLGGADKIKINYNFNDTWCNEISKILDGAIK